MHGLLQDLTFALRMLFKSPGYTLVAILTLDLAAYGLTRLTAATLVDPSSSTDLLIDAGVAALLAFVGLLATCLPARRATRIDPMVALRHE